MDNSNSQPSIVLPVIPADFESAAGTSKTDFLKAAFALIAASEITGIQSNEPSPYDIGVLAGYIKTILADLDEIKKRRVRRVFMAGISNGVVIAPFPDIGTTDYQVDVAFVTVDTDLPNSLMWAIIKDSKSSNQVSLRINGNAAQMDLEITINSFV